MNVLQNAPETLYIAHSMSNASRLRPEPHEGDKDSFQILRIVLLVKSGCASLLDEFKVLIPDSIRFLRSFLNQFFYDIDVGFIASSSFAHRLKQIIQDLIEALLQAKHEDALVQLLMLSSLH